MRDFTHNIGVVSAIAAATYSNDNVPITIDRQNVNSLTFVLSTGVGGITFTASNRIDFVLEHSDDAVAWSPVDPSNVVGGTVDANGIFKSLTAAAPNPAVIRIGYVDGTVGDKRYVRVRADFSGTHGTGTPIDAIALLGNPRIKPAA